MKYFIIAFVLICFHGKAQQSPIIVYFEHGSWELNAQEAQKLKSLFSNEIEVDSILAFTNELGTVSYNQSLAYHRLQRVKNYLNEHQVLVDISKIHGENYPNGENPKDDDPSWRKVEIFFHKDIPEVNKSTEVVETPASVTDFKQVFEEQRKSGEFKPIQLKLEFQNGLVSLMHYSYSEVERLYLFLAENEEVNVFLKGHVCCSPSEEIALGRALTIYNLLVQKGIDKNRISYKGYSNTQPLISPELTEEDRQRNRRVEAVFSIRQ